MNENMINLEEFLGYCVPVVYHKFENGRRYSYCYSIKYNRDGKELSRTEPFCTGSLGYDDGTPFTESEYNRVKEGRPKLTFIQKYFKWLIS